MVAISTLIVQSASPLYVLCKDIFLYSKKQKRDIEELEERLSRLINHLISIKSAKEGIDRLLTHSPSMEPSQAYESTESEIAVINNKCCKFIEKYSKITNNRLSSTTTELLDASAASFMIRELGDFKSEIVTLNALKLAKLSRDIAKLSTWASECVKGLKPEKMMQRRSKPNLDKLDSDDHVLPVFDTYVGGVLHYLFKEKGRKIGILGCQGAGKTTVLRRLYNRLLQEEWLDNIIRIDLCLPETETASVEVLQKEIMAQLNIDHAAAASTVNNANTISKFLRNRNYVLLIDGVSASVDLEKLGFKDDHKHRKVVVCSREKTVLRQMTEHEIGIQRLKDDEALVLFQSIYGKLSLDDRKSAIAVRIIECCAGIPWMIRGVAIYLKDKDNDEKSWNYVKTILQSKPKSLELIGLGGFDKVYEMRYEGLETDAKKCLLYGALFPHKHKIYTDYLVECWIAEGFVNDEADQKVRLNRERGQTILNKLTDYELMQWYPGKKCITMPTNIRRVALELEYPDNEECSVWIPSGDRKPNDLTWTTVARMSLIGCKVELPQSPESGNLYTLLLESLRQEAALIPDSFFKHMARLQVLALNLTMIGALPESIKVLVNLKGLYLNGCRHLEALPSEAAKLVKLEFLDITGTSIPSLPQQIRLMVNMRCLRASLSSRDPEEVIPPGIISNLRYLEELSLVTAFDFGFAAAAGLAKELASLEHLNTLCLNFPDVSSLNTFVTNSKALNNTGTGWNSHTLRSFKISVGSHETHHPYEKDIESVHERWFRFSTGEEFSPDCQKLLDQASAFEVIGYGGLKSLTCSPFDLHPVNVCVVESCKDLENIMDGYTTNEGQGFSEVSLLPNMEKLHLYNLESLQCIWYGDVPPTIATLANLTAITINGCPKLTKILDPALATSLQSLEHLKVENCSRISTIIEESGETSEIVEESSRTNSDLVMTSLVKIELSNLPELRSISGSRSIIWMSLKSITVIKCKELKNLSLTLTNATELATIQCEESWWKTIPLPNELRQRLHPLCCFKDESIGGGGGGGGASSSGTSGTTSHRHNTSINPADDAPLSSKTVEGGPLEISSSHQNSVREMTGQLALAG